MLPAINFQHGLHYNFKVRFHWPCLSGSLFSRRSLNAAHKGNIIKYVLGKLKLLAITTTEKVCQPASTHLPSRQKQVSFSEHSPATRYTTHGILKSTLNEVWPSDHRSKHWCGPDDAWGEHKPSDQYFWEKLKAEHLKVKLCTKGAGVGRKGRHCWPRQRSAAVLTHGITTTCLYRARKIWPLRYQQLGYPDTYATGLIFHL